MGHAFVDLSWAAREADRPDSSPATAHSKPDLDAPQPAFARSCSSELPRVIAQVVRRQRTGMGSEPVIFMADRPWSKATRADSGSTPASTSREARAVHRRIARARRSSARTRLRKDYGYSRLTNVGSLPIWRFQNLRRVKKIATALIFEAAVSREAAERRLIDDLLVLFGGRSRPIMAHLIESGNLTMNDVREAEKILLTRSEGKDDKE
jgi:hypothetical protein